MIGHRWSPASHELRDFLARNQVPYQWLDVEVHPEAAAKVGIEAGAERLPVVVLPSGEVLTRPTNQEVATKIGCWCGRRRGSTTWWWSGWTGGVGGGGVWDVRGFGDGGRGARGAGRAGGMSSRIENYLGFPSGLSGGDLARRAVAQARRFGAELITPQEVPGCGSRGHTSIWLVDGSEIASHAVLVASGVSYRKLGAPGVEGLTGVGVYYGAAMIRRRIVGTGDLRRRRGELGGAGGGLLRELRGAGDDVVRGPSLAREMSQYLVDRIGRRRISRCRRGRRWRSRTATGIWRRSRSGMRNRCRRAVSSDRVVRFYRGGAADGVDRRCSRAG